MQDKIHCTTPDTSQGYGSPSSKTGRYSRPAATYCDSAYCDSILASREEVYLGPLERHVLQEMGCPVVLVVLIPAAGVYPDPDGRSLGKGGGL